MRHCPATVEKISYRENLWYVPTSGNYGHEISRKARKHHRATTASENIETSKHPSIWQAIWKATSLKNVFALYRAGECRWPNRIPAMLLTMKINEARSESDQKRRARQIKEIIKVRGMKPARRWLRKRKWAGESIESNRLRRAKYMRAARAVCGLRRIGETERPGVMSSPSQAKVEKSRSINKAKLAYVTHLYAAREKWKP